MQFSTSSKEEYGVRKDSNFAENYTVKTQIERKFLKLSAYEEIKLRGVVHPKWRLLSHREILGEGGHRCYSFACECRRPRRPAIHTAVELRTGTAHRRRENRAACGPEATRECSWASALILYPLARLSYLATA